MHPAAQLLHHGGDPVKREKPQKHEMLWGLLFVSPYILGLIIFWIGPIVAAVGLSFTYWDFFSAPEFIGLTNYKDLIRDPIFHRSVLNTLYYTIVTIPASIVLSLLLAVALNKAIKGIVWLRTCYFLPYVTSTVSVALLWSWLYNYDFGLLNHFLGKLRSEEHTSELQSRPHLVCRLLLEKKKKTIISLLYTHRKHPTLNMQTD